MPNLDPSILPVATSSTLGGVKAGTGTAVAADGTLTNAGVTSLVAGTGVSLSGSTGAVTVSNTGVTSLTTGTGISNSGTGAAPIISNTGVTSFNTRPGAVTLSSSDVATALGYTPSNGTASGSVVARLSKMLTSSDSVTGGTPVFGAPNYRLSATVTSSQSIIIEAMISQAQQNGAAWGGNIGYSTDSGSTWTQLSTTRAIGAPSYIFSYVLTGITGTVIIAGTTNPGSGALTHTFFANSCLYLTITN